MRQLKPDVVEKRKRDLLQWVVHYFIRTSKPVSSQQVAREAGMGLSSATIRNVLQELEEEGFLHQPHSSSGRLPTDKGYRYYVDYLAGVQRLASNEKEKLEVQYRARIEELDTLLLETSRLLSKASHCAGLVLSPQMHNHALKRLEIIQLGGRNLLGILVTEAGLVRHWPIQVGFEPTLRQIQTLNRFLNDNIQGCSIQQAQAAVVAKLRQMEREFRELSSLANELLLELGRVVRPEALYVDGADNILEHASEIGDMKALQSLMRLMGEKEALAGLLGSELEVVGGESTGGLRPHVRIGRETGIAALKDLSLVTTTYRYGDRVVGVLGVLGSKRMEYSRMMSLVEYMSGLLTRRLAEWEGSE